MGLFSHLSAVERVVRIIGKSAGVVLEDAEGVYKDVTEILDELEDKVGLNNVQNPAPSPTPTENQSQGSN